MLLRYRESKRCGLPMFPVQFAAELTNAQLWLLHWLQVYDWALTLPENERPSPEVIEFDQKFDEWYKQYSARKQAEHRKATAGQSASQHSHVIQF